MNYLNNEEKKIKSYLKKKVSFDLQTLVKFLITGVVAVSVTACGGGGGGGSSTSTPSNPIDTNTENITESVTAENKIYINEGSIEVKSKGESSYALAGKNSKIVNENKISITEGDTNTLGKVIGKVSGIDELNNLLKQGYNVGVFAQGGNVVNGEKGQIDITTKKGVGIYLSKATLENNGNINMNGNFQVNEQGIIGSENIGVWANNGSKAINNGKIILNTAINDTIYKGNYPLELPYSIGMLAENGSNIENKNSIEGTGNLIGMSITSNSMGVNNGNINLSSGKINSDVTFEEGENYKYNYDKFFYTAVIGMKADGQGSKVTNNKNIKIDGKGTGVVANNGATGINNGDITMTSGEIHEKGYSESKIGNGYDNYELVKSWAEVIGMSADNGNIENGLAGIITIDGNGKGMYGVNNSNLINNGIITVNGKFEYATPTFTDGEEIPSNYEWGSSLNAIGMEIVDGGKAENNGNIIMNADLSVGILAKNGEVINNNLIEINSKNDNILGSKRSYSSAIEVENGEVTNNGTIIGKGNRIVGLDGYNSEVLNENKIELIGSGLTGIYIHQGGSGINNGNITINVTENSDIASSGISLEGGKNVENDGTITGEEIGRIENNGTITIKGNKVTLSSGEINLDEFVEKISAGIKVENRGELPQEKMIVNSSTGVINISGSGMGIYAKNFKVENAGTINLVKGEFVDNEVPNIGIVINGGEGTNSGKILDGNDYSTGMMVFNGGTIINDTKGVINLTGSNVEGMSISTNGTAINRGEIYVDGYRATGMEIDGGIGENNGTITVIGKDASGMRAEGGTVTNKKGATINVGTGAIGMVADGVGSRAENYGTINIAADAQGGMRAWDGGTVANYGTIIIDKNHQTSGNTEGMSKEMVAIYASDGSTLENEGTIITDGEVNFETESTYIVGTNSNGTFGKLTASDVDLNGNLIISTDMVVGTYENSYKLDNIIEGDNINLGEKYKNLSDSLLYDVNTSKDEDGNLDGELVRNDNSISNFTNSNFSQVGKLFDKYLTKENYEKLSQSEKELVDKIFASTGSADEIKKSIKELAGEEYLNISRQIFDIKNSFRKYDTSVISTLDKYNHNFTLIGEYGDIQSKDEVVGYDSKMTGFNGAMRLVDNLYGTLGYGYSDIDYDNKSEGEIQTIHVGLYKDYTYNKADIRVGVFGEYNFHETDRENLDGHISTDYNSYLVGVTGEISKKYGDSLYIQPRLSLDVAYANVESFDEENILEIKEQGYTSILPKADIKVGKKFNNLELFAKSFYSYELGNLDKDMDIKLIEDIAVENDTMDRGNFDISVGTEVKFESLALSAELGKEFGKRDRKYVRAGITYKF